MSRLRRRVLLSAVAAAICLAGLATPASAILPQPDTGPGGRIPIQPRVGSISGPALIGEGDYRAAVTVAGQPVVQVTWLRPGPGLGTLRTGIMWLAASHIALELHPGYADPGNLWEWRSRDYLVDSAATHTIAAFNSGFKLKDIWGGYYDNGRYAQALKPNRAAIVVYADGHVDIGVWGVELRMTPQVKSVRQNQRILVDHGALSPLIDQDIQVNWGVTVGGGALSWRTGLGITAHSDLVFVAGPALTPRRLGETLIKAGAVRAIELDINTDWATGVYFTPGPGGVLVPHKIASFHQPAARYLSATDRDFFSVTYR